MSDIQSQAPQHYRASREVVGRGPLRELGSTGSHPVALAYWRAPAVDLVTHLNDAHPTLLFHAAGGPVRSEACNRFRASGRGWPGDAMLVPIGADIRCRWHAPVDYLHVYFRLGYLEQLALEQCGRELGELQDRSHVRDARLEVVLRHLLHMPWSDDDPLLLDGLALQLAQATLRTFSPLSGPAPEVRLAMAPHRLRMLTDYVDAHVTEAITIADLSRVAAMSVSHFARAFSRATGRTPYRFVMERRVERAKCLMASLNMSLALVAQSSGFSSASHLSTVFKQSMGLSPSQWRRLL